MPSEEAVLPEVAQRLADAGAFFRYEAPGAGSWEPGFRVGRAPSGRSLSGSWGARPPAEMDEDGLPLMGSGIDLTKVCKRRS